LNGSDVFLAWRLKAQALSGIIQSDPDGGWTYPRNQACSLQSCHGDNEGGWQKNTKNHQASRQASG
jgi:hypothetical protein